MPWKTTPFSQSLPLTSPLGQLRTYCLLLCSCKQKMTRLWTTQSCLAPSWLLCCLQMQRALLGASMQTYNVFCLQGSSHSSLPSLLADHLLPRWPCPNLGSPPLHLPAVHDIWSSGEDPILGLAICHEAVQQLLHTTHEESNLKAQRSFPLIRTVKYLSIACKTSCVVTPARHCACHRPFSTSMPGCCWHFQAHRIVVWQRSMGFLLTL